MKKIKLFATSITVVLCVLLLYIVLDNYETIYNKTEYLYRKYFSQDIKQTLVDNEYSKKESYGYINLNYDTNLKNKDDIKNAIYTFVDAGWDEYQVRCEVDYEQCIYDVKTINESEDFLTEIMGYVHPYNQFGKIEIKISSSGLIKFVRRDSLYNDGEIKIINSVVNKIYNDNYDESKPVKENIKIFHDYIINHTKYDKQGTYENSKNAYGALIEGHAICSGYTDAMALFLEKMNIKNYRVVSNNHTWNLVNIGGKWRHLDLTWDDPVTADDVDVLRYDYFLIDTNKLKSYNDNEHNYNENIYLELK